MTQKLSIITINLNNRIGLESTIQSVIAQDSHDFEFIVVDGLSSDGSVDLLKKYAQHITWAISEKDHGIYEAMNKGIAAANGQYLQFLNSGDRLYEKGTITAVLPHLNDTEIVYGDMKIDNKGVMSDGFMPETITLSQMVNDTLWHPVSFIKKDLFLKLGYYNTNYRIVGDYDFFFKAIVNNSSTKHIRQFIAVFDLTGLSSDSRNVAYLHAEKQKVQLTYLSQDQIDQLKTPLPAKKQTFSQIFRKWFQ